MYLVYDMIVHTNALLGFATDTSKNTERFHEFHLRFWCTHEKKNPSQKVFEQKKKTHSNLTIFFSILKIR